jgi:basic membrane protein A
MIGTWRAPRVVGSVPVLAVLAGLAVLAALAGCGYREDRKVLTLQIVFPVGGSDSAWYATNTLAATVFAMWHFDLRLHAPGSPTPEIARDFFNRMLRANAPSQLLIAWDAPEFPELRAASCALGATNVLLVEAEASACPRVRTVAVRTYTPSFLAGVAAATVGRRVAVLAAAPTRAIRESVQGFTDGARFAGGDVVTGEYLAGDLAGFEQRDRAAEWARVAYSAAGVDVIFAPAGVSGMGVVDAARASPTAFSPHAPFTT